MLVWQLQIYMSQFMGFISLFKGGQHEKSGCFFLCAHYMFTFQNHAIRYCAACQKSLSFAYLILAYSKKTLHEFSKILLTTSDNVSPRPKMNWKLIKTLERGWYLV